MDITLKNINPQAFLDTFRGRMVELELTTEYVQHPVTTWMTAEFVGLEDDGTLRGFRYGSDDDPWAERVYVSLSDVVSVQVTEYES